MPQSHQIDLAGVSVQIGMPVAGPIHPQVMLSMVDTCCALKERGLRFDVQLQYGCSIVEQARDFVLDTFLRAEAPFSHLFMIDADMEWTADDFLRLLALGTRLECVAGIYPRKQDVENYVLDAPARLEPNEYGCFRVLGLGLGFCCVQHQLLAALARRAPQVRYEQRRHPVSHLFRCDVTEDGCFRGEDMAFFSEVRAAGYPVWLDPHLKLGHVGLKTYRGDFWAALQKQSTHSPGEVSCV